MNIIEFMREKSINNLFNMKGFNNNFLKWTPLIESNIGKNPDFFSLLNLGDSLGKIFRSTGIPGREQGALSGGGSSWEGLVCWYLNLCLIGSRTVVIKHSRTIIPPCVADAITVNYGSFVSNTESDLVAITFPNENEFIQDTSNFSFKRKSDYITTVDKLSKQYFDKLEVGIVQCKTNWNDNAQIPMLWEIVYSSTGFTNKNITIGKNGFSMKNFKKFFYGFVTVPSGSIDYTPAVLPVKRVNNLSGGNYWGKATSSGVAQSIKEIFNKNFSPSCVYGTQQKDVESQLRSRSKLAYFRVSL